MFGQMKVKVHAPQLGVRGEHSNTTSPQEGVKHTPGEDQRPRFSYPADLRMPAGPQVGKATVAPQNRTRRSHWSMLLFGVNAI